MLHTQTRTVTVTETYVTCDRCGREMRPDTPDLEHQERVAVRFRAGYASAFGDGSLVEMDLCQHCVKDVLGRWLRVTPDDPVEPMHSIAVRGDPKGAYQQYQLADAIEAEALRQELRNLLRVKPCRPDSN